MRGLGLGKDEKRFEGYAYIHGKLLDRPTTSILSFSDFDFIDGIMKCFSVVFSLGN